MGKTLGLTSTGPVAQYLVDYLTKEHTNSQDQSVQREFFDIIDEIVLLHDQERRHQPPTLGIGTSLQERITSAEGFNALYRRSHVLLDCSGDFVRTSEVHIGNIPAYLQPILNRDEYNLEKLYPQYTEQAQNEGRIPLSKDRFMERLEMTAKIIDILNDLKNDGYEISGRRLGILFPLYFPLMLERALLTRDILKSGLQGKAEQDLPVYVMVTNEPTMMCNLFSFINPEMRERLIASSGVDCQRLFTSAYKSFEEYARHPEDINKLEFSIQGAHDHRLSRAHVKIKDGQEVRCDIAKLRDHLQEKLDEYLSGQRKPEIWQEFSRALTLLIVNTAKSIERGLTIFPQDSFLCDGYYHETGAAAGLFLSGEYQFCNGFVVPREQDQESRPELKLVINTSRELLHRLKKGPLRSWHQEATP